ncbi:MAG: tetratricopeptide repeat protein [Hyphomicrobiaceae bacterium]
MLKRTTLPRLSWVFLTSVCMTVNSSDACERTGKLAERIAECSRFIASRPRKDELAKALLVRGEAYARKGMNDQAISDFAAVISIEPVSERAFRERGYAYLANGKFDMAITDFSNALTRNSKDVSALIARGYAHLVERNPKLALNDFTAALHIDPRNLLALNNRGLAYKKLGKPELAIADFTTAIDLNPLYGLAYNNRGYAYEELGNKSKAVADFRHALVVDPSLVGARNGLVRLGGGISSFAAHSSSRIAIGRRIAEKNCAWCHAIGKEMKSPNALAPSFLSIHLRHPILALRTPISRAIATPHDAMPKLPLTNKQIDQVIAYINSLKGGR